MLHLFIDTKKSKTKSYNGTGRGRQFYTHGLKNVGELVDEDEVGIQTQEDEEKNEEQAKSKPKPKLVSHAEIYKRTLEEAKLGGQDLVPKKKKSKKQQHNPIELTAEQLEAARLALDQVRANEAEKQRLESERRQLREEESHLRAILPSTIPIDINGCPNATSNPVFFQAPHMRTATLPGIPYPVSDTVVQCRDCIGEWKCRRHCRGRWHKTDISLCRGNHMRLVLHWDMCNPVNERGTWSIEVKSYMDRFSNGAGDHERCEVYAPTSRVKELGERVVSDYVEAQREKERGAFLDARGREVLRDGRVGAMTSLEYLETASGVALGQRIEREIKVLVLFWQRREKWRDMGLEEKRVKVKIERAKEWTGMVHKELDERVEEWDGQDAERDEWKLEFNEQRPLLPMESGKPPTAATTLPNSENLSPRTKQLSKEEIEISNSILSEEEQNSRETIEQKLIAEMQGNNEQASSSLFQRHDDEERDEASVEMEEIFSQSTSPRKNKRKRSPFSLDITQESISPIPSKKHKLSPAPSSPLSSAHKEPGPSSDQAESLPMSLLELSRKRKNVGEGEGGGEEGSKEKKMKFDLDRGGSLPMEGGGVEGESFKEWGGEERKEEGNGGDDEGEESDDGFDIALE